MSSQVIGELILSKLDIQKGVSKVADELNEHFKEEDEEAIVFITMIPGGMFFSADLLRELKDFDVKMDYISCPHTPGDRNNNSSIIFNQNILLEGKHVVLVDDAIESGGTMKRVSAYVNDTFNPKSLSIATLFVKPGRVDIPFKQFYAYEMTDDGMLVGYGLPWQDKLRNIPYLSKLNKQTD